MRKFILTLFLLSSLPLVAHATSVTATVTDAGGQTWNNGTWSATLVTKPGFYPPAGDYLIAGTTTSVPNQHGISGALDNGGAFSTTLTDVTTIAPAGATWRIQVCPLASGTCFIASVDVTGGSESISSQLAPPALRVNMAVPLAYYLAYSDAEIVNGNIGQFYWNLTASALKVCSSFPCGWTTLTSAIGYSCGENTTTCVPVLASAARIFYGSATLNGGNPSIATVTGFSPAYSSTTSYVCTVEDANSNQPTEVVRVSTSSITIIGPNASTDLTMYLCIGN